MYTLSIDLSKSKDNSKSDQQFRVHFVFINRWFVINKFWKTFSQLPSFYNIFCIDFPPIPWWIVLQHNLLALWDLQEPMLIIIDLIWFETNVQNDSIMDVSWWVSLKPQLQMANRKKKYNVGEYLLTWSWCWNIYTIENTLLVTWYVINVWKHEFSNYHHNKLKNMLLNAI